MLAIAVAAMPCASCAVDDTEKAQAIVCPGTSMMFEGKWSAGTESGQSGRAWIYSNSLLLEGVPYAAIVRQLMPGSGVSEATPAGSGVSTQQLQFAATASESTTLLTIMPAVWDIEAVTENGRHTVRLSFTPGHNDTENISWGTLSGSGMLTLILHATSFTVDGGSPTPASLKLTLTAARK